MSAPDWTKRQLMAEFIATSTFVWAGCGTSRSSRCLKAGVDFDINPILSFSSNA
jgi:hypothetical protein